MPVAEERAIPAADVKPRISVVVPALNEAGNIVETLHALQPMRSRGHEVIVADGGSVDGTRELAQPLADRLISSPRGRARQMNAGAEVASGDVLWFLHGDTVPMTDADLLILEALGKTRHWGRFDVRLSGRHWLLRVVEAMMNLRSCVTGIATGDQGIFVTREVFDAVAGFPDIPLMEDIALSKRLKGYDSPACERSRLITSSRRWERNGVVRTIAVMWRTRLAYFLGADPRRLAESYRSRLD